MTFIKIKNDIPYAGTENPRQSLNLILPKNRKKKILPALYLYSWRRMEKTEIRTKASQDFYPYMKYGGVRRN